MKYFSIFAISMVWWIDETGGVTFNIDSSLTNAHVVVSRIFSFSAASQGACGVACFKQAQCTSFGYGTSGTTCQGYSVDVSGFIRNFVQQDDTQIFKAVCDNSEYTFIRSLNLCMKRVMSPAQWNDARVICSHDDAQLVDVSTVEMQLLLKDTLLNLLPDVDYWSGGVNKNPGTKAWEWQSGELFNETSPTWIFWEYGDPMIVECLSLVSNLNDLRFRSLDCNVQKPYICVI